MLSILTLSVLAQTGGFLGPLEETLDTYSFGPTISAHAVLDKDGVHPALAVGAAIVSFDVEKIYEPRCVEHRKHEQEQLGGGEDGVLGDLIEKAQQECPAIGETVDLSVAVAGEADVAIKPERELTLRIDGTLLSPFRMLGIGVNSGLVIGERSGSTEVGLRAGLDVSWMQRLGRKGFRPVIAPFVRGELTLLNRSQFADQLSAGVRVLIDL